MNSFKRRLSSLGENFSDSWITISKRVWTRKCLVWFFEEYFDFHFRLKWIQFIHSRTAQIKDPKFCLWKNCKLTMQDFLRALSPSDAIEKKNSDWISEIHRVIWLDKNAMKWYWYDFSSRLYHTYILSQYMINSIFWIGLHRFDLHLWIEIKTSTDQSWEGNPIL